MPRDLAGAVTRKESVIMARTPRDTVTYDLKVGHRVVYLGTTDDPDRRAREHLADGKRFTRMTVTSVRLTEESAKAREAEALARYRRGHGGRDPKYTRIVIGDAVQGKAGTLDAICRGGR